MIHRIIKEENPVLVALTETQLEKDEIIEEIPGYITVREIVKTKEVVF